MISTHTTLVKDYYWLDSAGPDESPEEPTAAERLFQKFIQTDCDDEELRRAVDKALPRRYRRYVKVFVKNDTNSQDRVVEITWMTDADKNMLQPGMVAPSTSHRVIVNATPWYAVTGEFMAEVVLLLPSVGENG